MKASILNPDMTTAKCKTINQAHLTSECWSVQIWGISACSDCEFLDTDKCGGKRIREQIRKGEFPRGGLPNQNQEGDQNEEKKL